MIVKIVIIIAMIIKIIINLDLVSWFEYFFVFFIIIACFQLCVCLAWSFFSSLILSLHSSSVFSRVSFVFSLWLRSRVLPSFPHPFVGAFSSLLALMFLEWVAAYECCLSSLSALPCPPPSTHCVSPERLNLFNARSARRRSLRGGKRCAAGHTRGAQSKSCCLSLSLRQSESACLPVCLVCLFSVIYTCVCDSE